MANKVSYQGKGTLGWRSYIGYKYEMQDYPCPEQFEDDYATGDCIDVTPGLFDPVYEAELLHYLKEDGTYPTGICEDYNGNWMLRRVLKTENGTEYVAEGTVSEDGTILEPICIKERIYRPDTVYPLNGSWEDVFRVAKTGTWDLVSAFNRMTAGYVNLIVPLSLFKYLQYEYEMYDFGELSSRTFYTGVYPQKDGTILLNCIFDTILNLDNATDPEEENVFLKALLSQDGGIIEPLKIVVPSEGDVSSYRKRYGDCLSRQEQEH